MNCSFKSFTFELEVSSVTSTSLPSSDTVQSIIETVVGVVTEQPDVDGSKYAGSKFAKTNFS